jgi:hypothetical protein
LAFSNYREEFAMVQTPTRTQTRTQRPPIYADRERKHTILPMSLRGGKTRYYPAFRKGRNWNHYSDGNGGSTSFSTHDGARLFFESRNIRDY